MFSMELKYKCFDYFVKNFILIPLKNVWAINPQGVAGSLGSNGYPLRLTKFGLTLSFVIIGLQLANSSTVLYLPCNCSSSRDSK